MNKADKELEQKKEEIKKKLKTFFKKKDQVFFYSLILAVIIFKIYYFIKTANQAIWWDEGDYLAVGKELFLTRERPEWWVHFTGIRPMFMPITWSFLFSAGFAESTVKFLTLVVPSILTIVFIYKIGRDLYGKNVGLIAAIMMAVQWVHSFYTYRFLTDIPAMFFGILAIYFFWSQYITRNKNWGLYLGMIFGVIAASTRFPLALVPMSFVIYLFAIHRFKLLKDKVFWKGILAGFIAFLPYIIYFIRTKFSVFKFYFGESAVSMSIPVWSAFKTIMGLIPILLEDIWFICLFIGIAITYELFIGFDLFLKQKTKRLNADFFVVLWALLTLFFYIVILKSGNDRWLLMVVPPLFFLTAKGIVFVADKIKKHSKVIAIVLLVAVVAAGAYQHLSHGDQLIKSRVGSYYEEKLGGIWLRENTPEDAKIIITSVVQNQYYSERQSYDFYTDKGKEDGCYDLYGNVVDTPECMNKTEMYFREKIKEIDADYLVIHVFEPVFTPRWAYAYPEKYSDELQVVQSYHNDQGQPMLVIYKFNKESEVFK